jgi:hypothetical protein
MLNPTLASTPSQPPGVGATSYYPFLQTLNELKPDVVHYQYPTAVYKRQLLITFLPILVALFSLFNSRRLIKDFSG